MAKKKTKSKADADIETILSSQLGADVGAELAEKLSERYDGITPGMTRSEAIARVMTEKAANGDLAAAKYIFETAKHREEEQKRIPFAVEFETAGDEI